MNADRVLKLSFRSNSKIRFYKILSRSGDLIQVSGVSQKFLLSIDILADYCDIEFLEMDETQFKLLAS